MIGFFLFFWVGGGIWKGVGSGGWETKKKPTENKKVTPPIGRLIQSQCSKFPQTSNNDGVFTSKKKVLWIVIAWAIHTKLEIEILRIRLLNYFLLWQMFYISLLKIDYIFKYL
jgi:hypothetical protein